MVDWRGEVEPDLPFLVRNEKIGISEHGRKTPGRIQSCEWGYPSNRSRPIDC